MSGNLREFVFPFISSVEKAKIDTIMANKSILIFAGVEQERFERFVIFEKLIFEFTSRILKIRIENIDSVCS